IGLQTISTFAGHRRNLELQLLSKVLPCACTIDTASLENELMDPRLVAIAGPLKGATFSLALGPTTIGRDISSDVVVSDSRVSRRHASIALDEKGDCRISDIESANGTLVNGVPIRGVPLKEGDVIQGGASLFLFALPPPEAPVSSPLSLVDPDVEAETTVRFGEEDLIYFRPEPPSSGASSSDRLLSELKGLLSLSKTITALRDI